MRYTLIIVAPVLLSAAVASAQAPVVPAANIEGLFKDNNAKLNENKQVVYHIVRDLLQCKRWNQADHWLTERYIQHNPVIPSGRAAIVGLFGNRPAPESCDEKIKAPIVAVLADGDLVTVVTAASLKDPKGEHYTTTWFDMWRIVGGKADEHWDPMVKQH